jgi:hypothetical protein
LWNVVSRRADDMLDQSPEYRLLLDAVPDAQGKPWWEIQPRGIESLKNYSREGLLRKLSLQAIRSHPVLFAKLGVENALQTFVLCPPRLGLDPAFYCNPLRRDSMLPPIATSAPPLDHFLSAFHGLGTRIYAYAVTGAVLLCCLMNVLARSRPTRQRETCGTFQRRVSVFLVFVLVATFYVSGQIERPNDRFVVPYLPVIALMVSMTVAMLPKSQRVLPPAGPPVG